MSDPMTNVEIEDVLMSIRRLVSDGDKARLRDPAPAAQSHDAASQTEAAQSESAASNGPGKLVLTPAFLVVDGDGEVAFAHRPVPPIASASVGDRHDDTDDTWEEDAYADASASPDHAGDPLPLTDMVWEDVEDTPVDRNENDSNDAASPDRSDLVASIAELEAAMNQSADEFEPDGSEIMDQAIEWPRDPLRGYEDAEDAEASDMNDTGSDAVATEDPAGTSGQQDDEAQDDHDDDQDDDHANDLADDFDDDLDDDLNDDLNDDPTDHRNEAGATAAPQYAADDAYNDDDLDGLIEAGGLQLDEAALRALVADVVREELTGPLGERITRNVRKLVRREIYRILSSQDFD